MNDSTVEAVSCWKEQGIALAGAHNAQQWEIVDWIVAGTELHPSDLSQVYDLAEQLFGYSRETLKVFARMGRAFPACTRIHDKLTFTHYRVVLDVYAEAALEPENKEATAKLRGEWLAQAEEKRLTVAALRFAIRNSITLAADKEREANRTQPAAQEDEPQPSGNAGQQASADKPQPKARDYNLPLSQKQKNALEALATIRGISPAMLAAHAVAEYLEAYADESADAAARQKWQAQAAMEAACAIHKARREQMAASVEYSQRRAELLEQLTYKLWNLNDNGEGYPAEFYEYREWLKTEPPIEQIEARADELLAAVQARDAEVPASVPELPEGEEPFMPPQPYVSQEQANALLADPDWLQEATQ